MARFFGKVGYAVDSVEKPPDSGIWVDVIEERHYYGNVIRNNRRMEPGDKVNSDISVGNSISILADPYAIEHFIKIKYLEWEGALWTVTSVVVQRPRLILDIGEVYHGPTA